VQFKTYHIHAANATGVTVARALAEGLLTDEEFFMQAPAPPPPPTHPSTYPPLHRHHHTRAWRARID
jgi:hypothetical protein